MRCKGPRSQNFFLRSRFYLTGAKSEISRKIPRLTSARFSRTRVRDETRNFGAAGAALASRHRRTRGAPKKACAASFLTK